MPIEAVIRMHAYQPSILTTNEFEQLLREVRGRVLADDAGVSDKILMRMIDENQGRYFEATDTNKARGIKC